MINSIRLTKNKIKITERYKNGYNMDIMRLSTCLVVSPIMLYSYIMVLTLNEDGGSGFGLNDGSDRIAFIPWLEPDACLWLGSSKAQLEVYISLDYL